MKSVINVIVFLLILNVINGQSTIIGQVLDNETKEALAYVNIGIKNSSVGTVSDENGDFSIELNPQEDTLIFSYLGYSSSILIAEDFKEPVQILMHSSPFMLSEIKIESTNFDQEVLLGSKNKNGRGLSIAFGNPQLGTELGTLIKISQETFVKSVNVVLNHAEGDSLLFRLNMYDYKDGKIGQKILNENIYIKEKQRKGTFTVNLEEYEILLTNDILLTVEWLKNFDENGNEAITFDTKRTRKHSGVYVRVSKTSSFEKLRFKRNLRPCIYLIGKQN